MQRPLASLALCALLGPLVPSGAQAQTITSRRESTPFVGVRVVDGRTSNPATDFHAAFISLCSDYVHVAATRAPSALQRTSAWATAAGVQLAVNGDFFTPGPRIYGYAIGSGVGWPVRQTGIDPAVSGEWYYRRYGWIAFGAGTVEFSHTEWVKQHAASLGVHNGWMPTTVTTAVPRGLTSLVSGFPELITEGTRVSCSSPTASSCFPDRTDMRARNPRSAMGITRDRRTFILLTIDGRSSTSAGMYGTEEARLMELLGGWQAFNLDGGGSTTFWQRGRGVVNRPSDATGERSVGNHWGIFAGSASRQPRAPGSCVPLAPTDAGVADAGPRDAAMDAPRDVTTDAPRDVTADSPRDVLNDAPRDALSDAATPNDLGPRTDGGATDSAASDVSQDDTTSDDVSQDDAEADDVNQDDTPAADDLPEFDDAPRAEMPPPDELPEAPGCGCRTAASARPPGGLALWGAVMMGACALSGRRRPRCGTRRPRQDRGFGRS